MSPFEIVNGFNPRKPIDLNPCSMHDKTSFFAEKFAIHINSLHDKIEKQIYLSNEVYKRMADSHIRNLRNIRLVIDELDRICCSSVLCVDCMQ